jgi:hypothetical protein
MVAPPASVAGVAKNDSDEITQQIKNLEIAQSDKFLHIICVFGLGFS